MRTKEQMLKKIGKNVENIIRVGKARIASGDMRFGAAHGLRDMAMWWEISALCDALEIDSLKYWNRICSECPNLGGVTDN